MGGGEQINIGTTDQETGESDFSAVTYKGQNDELGHRKRTLGNVQHGSFFD